MVTIFVTIRSLDARFLEYLLLSSLIGVDLKHWLSMRRFLPVCACMLVLVRECTRDSHSVPAAMGGGGGSREGSYDTLETASQD